MNFDNNNIDSIKWRQQPAFIIIIIINDGDNNIDFDFDYKHLSVFCLLSHFNTKLLHGIDNVMIVKKKMIIQ